MPKLQSSTLQSIGFKIFLSLTLTALGAVLVLAIMFWFSLGTGFSDYLARLELTRLDTIEASLLKRYQQHNNTWDFVRSPRDIAPPLASDRRQREREQEKEREHDSNEGPLTGRHPKPKHLDAMTIGHRLALLNARGGLIMGRPEAISQPHRRLVDENNNTIGFIALAPEQIKRNDIEQQFIISQWRNMIIGCLFAVFISALVAIVLARYFRRPILDLATAAKELAQGNLSARVTSTHQDELGALASDFNHMAQKLESLEQSRKQWIADTSHELRTPLTILRAHTEAMRDGIMPLNQHGLANIDSAIKDLELLVADLYQLARADIGLHDYTFENIQFNDLLSELSEKFSAPFKQHELKLEISFMPSLILYGDEGRLIQLFSNLMNNSMRYTHAGGMLKISAMQVGNFTEITLDDGTPGVSDDALPHLFERFYRVDASHNRSTGGSGLGLSICQAIVTSHGGKISADHSYLGGLQIKLYLPLATAK
jgi:two-component system, OmpR family, sensor histidine kinase BaeS